MKRRLGASEEDASSPCRQSCDHIYILDGMKRPYGWIEMYIADV